MKEALFIQVSGIVQGVGFRPFVYRLAREYLVTGWVLNATDGVSIHAEGEAKLLDEFVIELSERPPAASKVEDIELKEVPLEGFETFEIRFSDDHEVKRTTLVSPDLATCDDCVHELFDPEDRRFRYPFINCTNCGPRFTIIEKLPYDRKSTSMKDFPQCERCAGEYADPLDRRFHAQPNACFDCGPQVSWCEHEEGDVAAPLTATRWGVTREGSDAIFARAVELLIDGKVVAVKGLGGFHLVCDANNSAALATLRKRKRREGKAFAVMAGSVDEVRRVCAVGEAEASILEGTQRPIVLLRKRVGVSLAPGLADRLPELGVMLPYTPVQHLLMHDFTKALTERKAGSTASSDAELCDIPLLVMTSGNIHDEPIVIDDGDACAKLFGVADAFLGNNRAIRARYDDSVLRVVRAGEAGEAVQFIRRARGYSPLPIALPEKCVEDSGAGRWPSFLATGPEQKNTFTLTRDTEAFTSQHIGDMENAETFDAWLQTKDRYETLFEVTPTRIVCDRHPEYLTSKWAHDQSLPVVEVQHHQAHIVAVMGEHQLEGPVCGIAFDGTGYGVDGAIWGGEVLLSNLTAFERFANFAYVPLPGGAAAVKHPLRMAYGVLWAFDLLDHPGAAGALQALGQQADVCSQMIDRGLNTPVTSSVGRLFDAASALLDICTEPLYEGEPAILLEAAMGEPSADPRWGTDGAAEESVGGDAVSADEGEAAARYAIVITKNTATSESTAQDTSVVLLDAAATFRALLDDRVAGVPVATISRRFHDAFVRAIIEIAELVRDVYDIGTVALSGGVFMNRYLTEHALAALESDGFTVAVNRDLPPNDGCVSFGQAVVAWASNNRDAVENGA